MAATSWGISDLFSTFPFCPCLSQEPDGESRADAVASAAEVPVVAVVPPPEDEALPTAPPPPPPASELGLAEEEEAAGEPGEAEEIPADQLIINPNRRFRCQYCKKWFPTMSQVRSAESALFAPGASCHRDDNELLRAPPNTVSCNCVAQEGRHSGQARVCTSKRSCSWS